MIRSEALGELKDSAAGLVSLSELLASRRVGPRAVAAALPSASEMCAGIVRAAEAVAADVISVLAEGDGEAAAQVRAVYGRAVASVRALEIEAAAGENAPGDARTRLVLERAATIASANVAAGLFAAEMFAAASAPRTVSIRVADVLSFGPALPEGPLVARATLEAPPDPVATTDARLLRALVELGVQIVSAAGVSAPHIQVTGHDGDGARIRIGAAPSPLPPSSGYSSRRSSKVPAPAVLAVRRLPWGDAAPTLARAAASMTGAAVLVDPHGRGVTLVFS